MVAAGEAAGVLWRVATDCDKAKLEVAKAGAVAPAVALLQAVPRDTTCIPAATEVHLVAAVHYTYAMMRMPHTCFVRPVWLHIDSLVVVQRTETYCSCQISQCKPLILSPAH